MRPPPLAELQERLRRLWTEPRGLDAALARDGAALAWIESGRAAARAGLAVYSGAYFARLLEVLEADFRSVRRALGARAFRRLAAEYLQAHPSRSPDLGDLGAGLPSFIEERPPRQAPSWLGELAKLEAAVLSALRADRLPPLDARALRAAAPGLWSRARCRLDPTARLLDFRWPVDRFWRGGAVGPRARRRLLVWRDDEWVRVRPLEPGAWAALDALRRGRALGEACAAAKATPATLGAWFRRWTAGGVIKRVDFLV